MSKRVSWTCMHFFSEGSAEVYFKQQYIARVNHYRETIDLPPISDIPD